MRIKLILISLFSLLLNTVIGQVITGEANPCPETNYTYIYSGPSYGNYFLWSITDGQIISQNTNTVVVKWYNNITENGKWKLRVQYETIKFDGSPGGSTYLEKSVKVNVPSRYIITGDKEIPGDFIGNKTYTAQIVNSNFPAASFLWTTNTGIQTTTTTPSFNVNITDDQLKWITVAGKSSTCPQWGEMFKFDIVYTPVFTGPSTICSEGIFTIASPGTITLENAVGVATLTALGNNQWKVIRTGTATRTVILRSTSNGKTFDKEIIIGGGLVTGIQGPDNVNGGHSYVLDALTEGIGTIQWQYNSPYINSVGYSGNAFEFYTSEILQNQKNIKIPITAKFTSTCGTVTTITKTLTLNP